VESAKAGGLKKLIISEPQHQIGYLPLYVAQTEGYFAEEGLEVEMLQASGSANNTLVVSGEVWGRMGGPEVIAYADAGGNNPEPLVAVVNCVNRGNVYLCARKGLAPAGTDMSSLKAFLQGKKYAASRYGSTPNLLTRYILIKAGLDPAKDVTLLEPDDPTVTLTLIQQGQADIGIATEPIVNNGIQSGTWEEPFYKFPGLGDYAYSVITVRKSTIAKDPETVQKFVNGMIKALKAVNDRDFALAAAKKEFPTLSEQILGAALTRVIDDKVWSENGFITKQALDQDMDVVLTTGLFTGTYDYNKMVDMSFVNKANGT
jgi:NitT/TauT family transport system substrate-binding protein